MSELVGEGMTELQEILITMSTQSCVLTVLLTLMIELIIQQIVIWKKALELPKLDATLISTKVPSLSLLQKGVS